MPTKNIGPCNCCGGGQGLPWCNCTLTSVLLGIGGFTNGVNKWYAVLPGSTAGGIQGTGFATGWWKFSSQPTVSPTGDTYIVRYRSLRGNLNGTYSTLAWNGTQFVVALGEQGNLTDPGIVIGEAEWWVYCNGVETSHGIHRVYVDTIWLNVRCVWNCEEPGSPRFAFIADGVDWHTWVRATFDQRFNPCHEFIGPRTFDGTASWPIFADYEPFAPTTQLANGFVPEHSPQGVFPVVDESPNCGWANWDAAKLAEAQITNNPDADCCNNFFCGGYELCEDLPVTIDDIWHCCGTNHTYADALNSTVSASVTLNGFGCEINE